MYVFVFFFSFNTVSHPLLLLCIIVLFFKSVFRCSNTFAWPLEQAAEGSLWGGGRRSRPRGEVWRGGLPLFTVGKIFKICSKTVPFWTTFWLSLTCSNTFARKCTTVIRDTLTCWRPLLLEPGHRLEVACGLVHSFQQQRLGSGYQVLGPCHLSDAVWWRELPRHHLPCTNSERAWQHQSVLSEATDRFWSLGEAAQSPS